MVYRCNNKPFSFFIHYKNYIKKINMLELYSPEQINRVMPTVFQHLGKTVTCTVRKCPDTPIPAGIGIFHRSILLPAAPLSDEELFYILVHETAHFINRDLLLKYIVQICICIFWWNPLLYVLQKDLCQLLEIRCDASVIKHLHAEETLAYMNTIINTIKRENEKHNPHKVPPVPPRSPVFLLDVSSDNSVQERFHVLCTEYKIRHTTPVILAAALFTFALFLWSYTFLLLPSYDMPVAEIEEDGSIYVDPENSFIIYEDGSYYIIKETNLIYISDFAAGTLLQSGFTLQNGE